MRRLFARSVEKKQRLRLHITNSGVWFSWPHDWCAVGGNSEPLRGERSMKRYITLAVVCLAIGVTVGCARGRTSWFNRGAPCSTCGQTAPIYNGEAVPSTVLPPPPVPETIPPAS
ncbi:MAG: hypothetical protein D6741_06785 [Planctomycetota bacterium]|nr:MAG: hypothetical protein D6741_06785 [Planctomycetota bacterium]